MGTLIDDVYLCRLCDAKPEQFAKAFKRCANRCPKKFPPTIGARGEAKLLFVALSPRLPNYVLDWCMTGPAEFETLAGNTDQYGRNFLKSYEAHDGKPEESFYRPYVEIAAEAYPGREFEEVAAVSDLYLCAYPPNNQKEYDRDYVRLPNNSPCANEFLSRIVARVRPKAIITKGNQPMSYFRKLIRRAPQYRTAYTIEIGEFQTTLLPLHLNDLNGTAHEPGKTWVLDRIRALDNDAS